MNLTKKFLVTLLSATMLFFTSFTLPAVGATTDVSVHITNISVNLDPASNRYLVRLEGELQNNSDSTITNTKIVLGTENQISSKYALAKFYETRNSANLTETDIWAKLNKVAARSTSSWNITFFADQALSFSNGLYGLGVIAYNNGRVASDVVGLPLFTAPPTNVLNVSMAVQISTLNYHLANGGMSASDERELARLTNLIINARDLEIAWIVDPSIYQWLAELANTNLKEQAAALSTLIAEVAPRSIPSVYSQPDVSRMMSSGREDDLTNLIIRTQQLSGKQNIVLAPINGRLSRAALKRLGEQGVRPIITNTAVDGDKFSSVQGTVVAGETSSLIQDESVLDCLKNNSSFEVRNCVLSTLTLISIDQVKNLTLLTPLDWAASPEEVRGVYTDLLGKTWLTITPLGNIMATPPAATYENLSDLNVEPFDLDFLETGDSISTSSAKISSVFADSAYSDAFALARLRGFSSMWQTGDLATNFLSANEDLLMGYQERIGIEASRNITIPSSSTQIPITIVNDSDRDISVVLQLFSPQTSRFTSDPSGVVAVPAGKRVTVPMNIKLTGKGIFNLTAALYAPNGQPVGKTKMVQISSAEYQGLARTLVLVAFGLLLLLSISNIVKRSRGNEK